MKINRYFSVLIMAFLLAVVLGIINTPQVSYAGTNGQQLSVEVCRPLNPADPAFSYRVRVTGKNQRGDNVTWNSGDYKRACKFETGGWWWVGKVDVTVERYFSKGDRPMTISGSTNVPKMSLSNWTTIKVNSWK